ncbi:MAG: hypothetical protein AAGF01_25155 [Cyanobacteria bacterium P01_G01_bin.38]
MTITCPKCKRADQIQKVSAIYANGTSNSSHTGRANGFGYSLDGELIAVSGSTTTYGSSQTMLAAQLAPPSMPKRPHWIWFLIPFLVLHLASFIAWFAPIKKSYKILLLTLGVLSILVGSPSLVLTYGTIVFFAPILINLAIYYFALFQQVHTHRSKLIPLWHKQMAEWNLLYYCSRDDCTFIPRG